MDNITRIEHCTSWFAQTDSPAPAGFRWTTVLREDACEDCQALRVAGYHAECTDAVLRRKEDCPRY